MDIQTFFMVMMTVIVGMAWYANYSKRDKLYCSFTRVDKTMMRKFVKLKSRYVVFDGKQYDVVPSCVKSLLWDSGVVGMLFPQRVQAMDFTYASRWPIDPATGKHVIVSPEVRKLMDKEEMFKNYNMTLSSPPAKKQTLFQQYLPWITIGLVALVFFYVYSNNQAFGQALADISNRVNAIAR